jgi:hypothetical protein
MGVGAIYAVCVMVAVQACAHEAGKLALDELWMFARVVWPWWVAVLAVTFCNGYSACLECTDVFFQGPGLSDGAYTRAKVDRSLR